MATADIPGVDVVREVLGLSSWSTNAPPNALPNAFQETCPMTSLELQAVVIYAIGV